MNGRGGGRGQAWARSGIRGGPSTRRLTDPFQRRNPGCGSHETRGPTKPLAISRTMANWKARVARWVRRIRCQHKATRPAGRASSGARLAEIVEVAEQDELHDGSGGADHVQQEQEIAKPAGGPAAGRRFGRRLDGPRFLAESKQDLTSGMGRAVLTLRSDQTSDQIGLRIGSGPRKGAGFGWRRRAGARDSQSGGTGGRTPGRCAGRLTVPPPFPTSPPVMRAGNAGQFSRWGRSHRHSPPPAGGRRAADLRRARPGQGTPTSGRHSPPKAGGGKDPQFRGGPFSAGIPAFGVIRTLEWQTLFAALWAPCLRPLKADGNEPPAALRAAVPTRGRRSLTHAPSRLPASRGLRLRSNRPEVGVPSPTRHRALKGTHREGSHPDGWGLGRRGPAGRCAGLKTGAPGPSSLYDPAQRLCPEP